MDEEEELFDRILIQWICNGYISKNIYKLNFKLKENRILQLENDEIEKIKFNNKLLDYIKQAYNLKNEKIVITNFKKDKNNYITLVIIYNFFTFLTKNKLLNTFPNDEELKTLTNIEKDLIIESVRLSDSILSPAFNIRNDKLWIPNQIRGGERYYPPMGWIKFSLNVSKKYDEGNDEWLSSTDKSKEWCVAYCGFSGMTKNFGQIYENENDIKHPGKKVGIGLYCSPFPIFLDNFSDIFHIKGAQYKCGFMIKVKPDKIRIPESNKEIWVLGGSDDDFRPYGILIKKL